MANLDALVQNMDQLRTQVQGLIHQNDQQGAVQEQNRIRIQQAIQQRGNQAEASSLRPASFKGLASEDADRWMKRFLSYSEFCNMDDQRKARIFRLMVEQAAEVWYNSLPEAVRGNWQQLQEAFNQKYINANNLHWLKEQGLFARVQGREESVESYITDVRQRCSQLQKGEAETRSIILRGLLPGIKAFVIGQQPADLEEVELKAKLAESIENLKPKDASSDRVNLMQDTYNKSLGDLSKVINNLEGMVRQQGRDVQFMKVNMRSQPFQGRSPQGQNPVVRGNFRSYCQRCHRSGHTTVNCIRRPQPSDAICYQCNRRGHLKNDCPQLKQRQFNQWNGAKRQSLNYQNASQNGAVTQPRRM